MIQLCNIHKNIISRFKIIIVFIAELAIDLIFGIRDDDSEGHTTFVDNCIPLN